MLEGETIPLGVVAWGHGGRQGSVPVFHIRGPRLTPSDFQAVVAGFPAIESHWILLFRGSGAFARKLAAPERSTFSSDCDSMFENDPVGMAPLLKILRTKPDIPFEELTDGLGKVTADWYS